MHLLSDLRPERAGGGRSRVRNVVIAGTLLLGFALMVGRVASDTTSEALGHDIDGFFLGHLADPSAYTYTPLRNGRQDDSFTLGVGVGSYTCHFQADAAGTPTEDAPLTCSGN